MASPALEALLFDVDGTLAETERDGHRIAFNEAFREAGLDWDWSVEQYGKLLSTTGGKERIHRFVFENNINLASENDLERAVADLHASKTRHYMALVKGTGIPLRPGVVRLVREARGAGLRLAIVTTTTPANVDALMQNSELADYKDLFEVIAAGDIVPNKKPAGDIYQFAMDKMNLQASQCLAIEDSEPGLASARDAGIRSVLITLSDYTLEHNFKEASRVVKSLGDAASDMHIDVDALTKMHTEAWSSTDA